MDHYKGNSMSFDQYYQDELTYLREMGEVFSHAYPKLAPYLSQQSQDPDVERLLEGFAFMAGKIRQKLDDQIPELSQELLELLWPNLLQPIPSYSTLSTVPKSGSISQQTVIPQGAEIYSKKGKGASCTFKTCYDVVLYPLVINSINLDNLGDVSSLNISLKSTESLTISEMKLENLRFYIGADNHTSSELYLHIFRYLENVEVVLDGDNRTERFNLDPDNVRKVGYGEGEALTPYPKNAFIGYRLLQEYFGYSKKFHYVDVTNLDSITSDMSISKLEIKLIFKKKIEEPVRVNNSSLQLYCTPIVNIFSDEADPIRLDHKKNEYLIRPSNNRDSVKKIFSIDGMTGLYYGGREKIEYQPYVSLNNTANTDKQNGFYYQKHIRPSVSGGMDYYASFIEADSSKKSTSTVVSVDLTCTNGNYPSEIGVGDSYLPGETIPTNVELKNICPPTQSYPPPIERDLQWQLISNMSLNYISLVDIKAFKSVLSTYNFQAYFDRQSLRAHQLKMEGITNIELKTITKLFKGVPVRGNQITIDVKSENFSGEGELFLFGTVLNEFLTLYATVNSFNQLEINDMDKGENYQWNAMLGNQFQM